MQYNPYINIDHRFPIHYESYFDDQTLQNLESHAKTFIPQFDSGYDKKGIQEHKIDNTFRKIAKIQPVSKEFIPFLDSLSKLLTETNNIFQFDVANIDFYYGEYLKHDSHLKWHKDTGLFPFNTRKISFTINVNSPDEYKGGKLEFFFNKQEYSISKGSITFFPSFLLHRVTPVTNGLRKVIFGFIYGPPYK